MRESRWWLVTYPMPPGMAEVKQVEWMTKAEAEVKARATGKALVPVDVVEAQTGNWEEVKG